MFGRKFPSASLLAICIASAAGADQPRRQRQRRERRPSARGPGLSRRLDPHRPHGDDADRAARRDRQGRYRVPCERGRNAGRERDVRRAGDLHVAARRHRGRRHERGRSVLGEPARLGRHRRRPVRHASDGARRRALRRLGWMGQRLRGRRGVDRAQRHARAQRRHGRSRAQLGYRPDRAHGLHLRRQRHLPGPQRAHHATGGLQRLDGERARRRGRRPREPALADRRPHADGGQHDRLGDLPDEPHDGSDLA